MIDVSNNNGHINWAQVRSAGQRIAAIKASEGSNHYRNTFYDDAYFHYNMLAAKANGILPCPYYFARPGTSAKIQARHFLTICRPYMNHDSGKLILDIEDSAHLSDSQLIEWVDEFCSILQAVIHRLTPIYSYSAFLPKFAHVFVAHPLWVANYDYKPPLPPNSIGAWERKNVYAHQYNNRGSCRGISGNVDISVRYVRYAKFRIGRRLTWN